MRQLSRWGPCVLWLVTLATLLAMFAFVVPTLLTVAGLAAFVGFVATARGHERRELTVSSVAAIVVTVVGIAFRAGPTTGIELPNAILIVEGVTLFAWSLLLIAQAHVQARDACS